MKRLSLGLLALSTALLIVMSAGSQPPDEKEKKGPPPEGKEKKGPPRFELGKLFPPFVMEQLELTPEQRKQLAELEKETRAKLLKILTAEQQKQIESMRPKGPPDGPEGKKDGPEGKKEPGDDNEKKEKEPLTAQPREVGASKNLIKNSRLTLVSQDPKVPADFVLKGDVEWVRATHQREFSPAAAAFRSGLKKESTRAGSLSQNVAGFEGGVDRWFRFSFSGLAETNFTVKNDGLFMKVDFFSNKGANALDGVTHKIYVQVERDRTDLAVNGNFRKNGGAVWRTFAYDFKLPFAEIDTLRLSVGYDSGDASADKDASFYVTELSLTAIAAPGDAPKIVKTPKGPAPSKESLIPLGGRWYYEPESRTTEKITPLTINAANAHRLYYADSHLTNPFAENMTAWLRKGYKDLSGKIVDTDRYVPDNVVIQFNDDKTMIVRAKNLPNHPTAQFPERLGGKGNPSYVQEHNYTYDLPLNPVRNPKALVIDKANTNGALPMGAIGIAINGVVFYNPFDAGSRDASDIMDRCCGHPSPDNRYHYHKYPVCVKSPFVDDGQEHSPLIGFAFDGFPIYGPYENKGLMAKDDANNPLNGFNMHYDEEHGWHYHVTPGKFPYVIGGYWGEVNRKNGDRKGPKN